MGLKHAPSPQDEVHRLGGPYGRCTKGAEGVDVQLLYNASYTLQVSVGPSGGQRERVRRAWGRPGERWSGEGDLESGGGPRRGRPGEVWGRAQGRWRPAEMELGSWGAGMEEARGVVSGEGAQGKGWPRGRGVGEGAGRAGAVLRGR